MSTHARLSASQTKRWWNCPGSVPVMAMFPELERPSGEAADLGTAAHRIVEECLVQGKTPDFYAKRVVQVFRSNGETSLLRKGAKLKDHDEEHRYFLVDEDMIEATTTMVEYVQDRLEAYGEPRDTAAAVKSGILMVETRVNPLPYRDDTGGTGDVIIKTFDEVEVIDYKNGSGVLVPVEDNHQLRTYAAGALNAIGKEADDYETVRYTIVQPRHFNGGIMFEAMTRVDLVAWAQELNEKANLVDAAADDLSDMKGLSREECLQQMADAGWLSVGEDGSHCGFCDLKPYCPAISNKAQELANIDFNDEPVKISAPSGDAKVLGKFLPWVPMLDSWTKAVVAEAERLAMNGDEVEGYKLVRKTGNRAFKPELKPEDVVKFMGDTFGISEESCFSEPSLLTGPALEKLITRENVPETMKTVKEAKWLFSEQLLYKPEGGLALVPLSDKRAAIAIDADSDFANEEI